MSLSLWAVCLRDDGRRVFEFENDESQECHACNTKYVARHGELVKRCSGDVKPRYECDERPRT